jgi:hypothetical protein
MLHEFEWMLQRSFRIVYIFLLQAYIFDIVASFRCMGPPGASNKKKNSKRARRTRVTGHGPAQTILPRRTPPNPIDPRRQLHRQLWGSARRLAVADVSFTEASQPTRPSPDPASDPGAGSETREEKWTRRTSRARPRRGG